MFSFWARAILRTSAPLWESDQCKASAYLFRGPATHPWRWPQGPDDSWPGLWVAVLRIGQRSGVAAGSQEVRLNHPLQLLAATHSIDAWHQVELLRDKKWKARVKVCVNWGLPVDKSHTATAIHPQLKRLLLSCVTFGKSHNLSELPFPHQS